METHQQEAPTFPSVPGDVLSTRPDPSPGAETFLRQVETWRHAAAVYLGAIAPAANPPLSPALAQLLAQAIAGTALSEAEARAAQPYGVVSFPAEAANEQRSPRERALYVLAWRAIVVDFLSDVWDTLGPATFDMEECDFAATHLFGQRPELCPDCVEPVEDWNAHEPTCIVRRFRNARPLFG